MSFLSSNKNLPFLLPSSLFFPENISESAWLGHIPFAFWIIDALKPKRFVELGTHNGSSYLAFCQAVQQLHLSTECFAVDTWKGDEHSGYYGEEVFAKLAPYNNEKYGSFSRLIRLYFDEAVGCFEDESIDLLHIDGLHTYEAVKHDFETWLPKMSDAGVILFHGINVRERKFGVWKFWSELLEEYSDTHFHFLHSHGLGVLGVGKNLPDPIINLFETTTEPKTVELLRTLYARLGLPIEQKFQYHILQESSPKNLAIKDNQIQGLEANIQQIHSQLQDKDNQLQHLHSQLQSAYQGWEETRTMIEAMETSKFWQLRTRWFSVKKSLGLCDEKGNPKPLNFLDSEQIKKGLYWTVTFQLPQRLKRRKIAQLIGDSGLFDTGYYLEQNPDIKQSGVDPLGHYIDIGASQGRDPHPMFHSGYYLKQYPEVTKSGMNPLAHYLTIGVEKGYKPCPTFDTGYYLKQYSEVAESGINPLIHYIEIGVDKGLNPLDAPQINVPTIKSNSSYPAIDPNIPKSKDEKYQTWLNKHYPSQDDLQLMKVKTRLFAYQPLISIIMPTYNTPIEDLKAAIDSVLNQTYDNWELCIADDASTDSKVRPTLEEYCDQDQRIKVVFREENGHISEASNSAIEIARGDFLALFEHNDLLTPHALHEVVSLLNQHRDADMIYSDEDKIDENGYLETPFFKPDWCPDSFLSRMYTCHFGVYRRSIVQKIGGFRAGYEGSQDYDLVLRFTEQTDKIYHIPNVLYHRRLSSNSNPQTSKAKGCNYAAAKQALSDAMDRRDEHGVIKEVPYFPGSYLIRYEIKSHDLVSIIIPTKNLGKMLDKCLTSIFELTTYPNYEVILIDNGTTEAEAIEVIKKWQTKARNRLRCFDLNIAFNFAAISNFAVKQAKGKYLLFLNNDTEVITADWIEGMVEQAQRPSIGAVGALLLYPDDTIQHAGVVAGIANCCTHGHRNLKFGEGGYFNQVNTINNYSAVTAACLMCRREVFGEIEGFDENLAVNYNDIDLCFKMIKKGYHNVYLPHVILYHYESQTRGYEMLSPLKKARLVSDMKYFQSKWKSIIEHDPCYNCNLTISYLDSQKCDYQIRI